MADRRVRLEPEQARRRQLDVQDSDHADDPQVLRRLAGLFQPAGPGMIKKVDRAEFVQGAQSPQREAVGVRARTGLLECRCRSVQAVHPLGPAEHGEGVAAHLRNGVARVDHATGEAPRFVQVADRKCGLGGQDAVTCGQRRVRVLRQESPPPK